jgi:hypothetical protein
VKERGREMESIRERAREGKKKKKRNYHVGQCEGVSCIGKMRINCIVSAIEIAILIC